MEPVLGGRDDQDLRDAAPREYPAAMEPVLGGRDDHSDAAKRVCDT